MQRSTGNRALLTCVHTHIHTSGNPPTFPYGAPKLHVHDIIDRAEHILRQPSVAYQARNEVIGVTADFALEPPSTRDGTETGTHVFVNYYYCCYYIIITWNVSQEVLRAETTEHDLFDNIGTNKNTVTYATTVEVGIN